jgi:hypothetical protein
MKNFLILFLAITSIGSAQTPIQTPTVENAELWMIQHFQIPPDALITEFKSVHVVDGKTPQASWRAVIHWRTKSADGRTFIHARIYDFDTATVMLEYDDLDPSGARE